MLVVYQAAKMLINPAWKAQITLLMAEKVSVPKEYTDFLDVFFKKSAKMLFKRSNINKHAINLEPDK